ncbi:protein ecdysoneless homolog [Plakobranchus ocellatus]|uniref:Protein ecdysoneless homolog n=1 Tax=Plakobranchus ocellatus TaxID=259542 RepID=A0AAV3Z495_9GAST|nr:protein ecdysoneless homolog [Plakobranchus ocellatus]
MLSDVGDIGQLVLLRLKTLEPKFQEFRTSTQNLPPSDDDSWINVTPEQVDELMKSAGGLAAENQTQPFDLSKISQSMSRFVEHESGIDGAEFPKEAVENGDSDGQVVGSGMIEAMQKLFDFPDEQDSTGSDMSEYDWSDGSDDELGSPSKMPHPNKKSSLRQPAKADKAAKEARAKSKSVRFSGPDAPVLEDSKSSEKPVQESNPVTPAPAVQTSPKPPVVPPRPSKLVSNTTPSPRPSKPPPPRPSNNPPPVPSRPSNSNRPVRPPPLSKPSGVVKPSAPPPPPPGNRDESGGKRDKKLEALMEAMDRELAATDVGKSFEREPKRTKPKRPGKPPAPPPNRTASATGVKASRDIEDEDDDFRPVNIDLNVVKNTLESYKAQQGLPGPASNILAGFGLKLPDDDTNTKG